MGARRMLTIADRVEIATGLKAGWSVRAIAASIGRAPSVVSPEVRRNSTKTRGYQVVGADVKAERRRARPQGRKVALDPVLEPFSFRALTCGDEHPDRGDDGGEAAWAAAVAA